jgi:predicted secreted protein
MGLRDRAPFHLAKEILGVTVTLAIIGAYLLYLTDGLASRCAAERNERTGPGTCSGMPAFASHVRGIVTIGSGTCAALAVIAFIWYMLKGYRSGRAQGYHDV